MIFKVMDHYGSRGTTSFQVKVYTPWSRWTYLWHLVIGKPSLELFFDIRLYLVLRATGP